MTLMSSRTCQSWRQETVVPPLDKAGSNGQMRSGDGIYVQDRADRACRWIGCGV